MVLYNKCLYGYFRIKLTNELFDDIRTMKKEFNYTLIIYIRMISQYGAIKAVKQLILKDDNTTGFTKLWQFHMKNF